MAQSPLYVKLVCILLLVSLRSWGQDPVFSQFHLNKNYLNPAYAGFTQDLGIGLNSRLQWSATPGIFSTNTFNANIGCAPAKLGFALTGYSHWEGEGLLNTTSLAVQSSVNFAGDWSTKAWKGLRGKKYIFSGGLSLGIGQKRIDWSKLSFSDQFDVYDGFIGSPSRAHPQHETSNVIFDMGAGVKGQSSYGSRGGYFSFGAAIHHLNRPVESFFGYENILEARYTAHGFWYFQLKKIIRRNDPDFLSAGVVFDLQYPLLTSTYLMYKDLGNIGKVGMGFRSRSFLEINKNTDAIVIQGMLALDNFMISYSYDLTVSSLGPQRTFGTHEVGITYVFKKSALCAADRTEDCFYLLSEVYPEMRDLYLWNP